MKKTTTTTKQNIYLTEINKISYFRNIAKVIFLIFVSWAWSNNITKINNQKMYKKNF